MSPSRAQVARFCSYHVEAEPRFPGWRLEPSTGRLVPVANYSTPLPHGELLLVRNNSSQRADEAEARATTFTLQAEVAAASPRTCSRLRSRLRRTPAAC